jgi:Tfp pilus assembly protein FimT
MAMPATSAIGSAGFTLFELLVILTILALLTSAWPLASSRIFAMQHLRNESQHLIGALRLAQVRARMTGLSESLEVTASGAGYRLQSEEHRLENGMLLHVRSVAGDTAQPTCTLFSDGSSTGGILDLSMADKMISVRVLRLTGRIEVVP